eukprot:NODE_4757_length_1022_cov_78.291435_g4552_i0.p2 GENE.NODE_4757_length_1022_cov_78.291435_g4552_i0~~NODE_4757_length_1022_cov_78.291435_g4552_i0.p2  ORF type:complete len:124 (-),score=15.10 NODE_4757_length_1022_cov_78.291435_g4552_i0:105-476(-)
MVTMRHPPSPPRLRPCHLSTILQRQRPATLTGGVATVPLPTPTYSASDGFVGLEWKLTIGQEDMLRTLEDLGEDMAAETLLLQALTEDGLSCLEALTRQPPDSLEAQSDGDMDRDLTGFDPFV